MGSEGPPNAIPRRRTSAVWQPGAAWVQKDFSPCPAGTTLKKPGVSSGVSPSAEVEGNLYRFGRKPGGFQGILADGRRYEGEDSFFTVEIGRAHV